VAQFHARLALKTRVAEQLAVRIEGAEDEVVTVAADALRELLRARGAAFFVCCRERIGEFQQALVARFPVGLAVGRAKRSK
jgi:hypothetical protein